ncbi:MAG: cytochrome c [Methylococcales bacterium]|nr:cytochrome c [Methylococcales bacterium]
MASLVGTISYNISFSTLTIESVSMKKIVFGLVLAATVQPASAADAVAQGKHAFETCRGCHSIAGYSNVYPTYHVPKVAGQRSQYIVEALTAYRAGERPHGTMKANANNLSDKTIENIAQYLEQAPHRPSAAPTTDDGKAGEAAAQTCLACHVEGEDGQANVPRLAGQHPSYLVQAMQDYQSGRRKNALMQSMVQNLSEAELNQIAAYFARQEGLGVVQ